MLLRTLSLSTLTWGLTCTAVLAATIYTDVPTGHWAAPSVDYAVDHGYMQAYPDQTFRGAKPLTRLEGVMALGTLLGELEGISKVSWGTDKPKAVMFYDMPSDPAAKAMVLRLATRYTLFDAPPPGAPGRFDGNAPMTRYELAGMLDHLLKIGEAKGVIKTDRLPYRHHTFTDVSNNGWAPELVEDVANHYQVMIGFADHTFRGEQKLTRYQFAAAAAQTFPLVRQLVIDSQPRVEATPKPVAVVTPMPIADPMPARFHVNTPLQLGAIGRGNNVIGGGVAGRLTPYYDRAFMLADFEAGVPLCTSELSHTGSVNLGYVFPLSEVVSLQPFVGGRMLNVGPGWLPGVNYGAIGYYRPEGNWDFFAIARGTNATTGMWGNGGLGLDYALTPGIALTLEGGYGLIPNTLNAPAGTPFGTDTAITGTVGLSVAL